MKTHRRSALHKIATSIFGLKVNVYLADLHDYKAMNEVYRGKFGKNPPVRTTVAVYGGVPGDSLVEMDCIATLKS
ncbi:RidA family protein [Sinomicrobium weinanense]|uniref:RidA family protein n=1 Tax=Sinomicrobium weinanense TaxID=2842200 RepID=UPI001FFD18B6|nr:RidA family protein [Sinomicrobium weinanense]